MKLTKIAAGLFITLISILFLTLLFTCAPITIQHPILNTEIPSDWEDEAVVILSDSIELELKEWLNKNELHEKHITWYKINKTSPAYLKTISIYDSEYHQYRPTILVTAIYKNGKIKKILSQTRKKTTERYKWFYSYILWMHYSDDYETIIKIPEYADIKYLRICITNRYKRPEHFSKILLRSEYNQMQKRIDFIWPASFDIKFGLKNKENVNVSTNELKGSEKNLYIVESNNLLKIKDTYKSKTPESWYAALYLSLPPEGNTSFTWRQLSDHLLQMIKDTLESKDITSVNHVIDSIANDIKMKNEFTLKEILVNKSSFGENKEIAIEDFYIEKTFQYVKNNIRYYGSWERNYGWIPRDPKTILEKGYGDCKEMSTLLTYILKKLNINAFQTSINTPGNFQIFDDFPVLSFNHMIVCVEKKDGYRLFLDPTNKVSTSTSSYHYVIGQKALIHKDGSSSIEIVKPDPDYQNKIATNSEIVPSSGTQAWTIKGKIQIFGELAGEIYQDVKTRENLEKSKLVLKKLKKTFKIQAQKATFSKLNPLEISIDFVADFNQCVLTSPAKGLIFTLPSIYTPDFEYSDLSYEGDRYLKKIDQTDTWIIPKGFVKNNFTNLTHSYGKGSWEKSNNTITRSYSCEFTYIDAAERDKLKNFFSERSNFERGIAWAK